MENQITIHPDQSKSYSHVGQALADAGFEYVGNFYGPKNPVSGRTKKYEVYSKNDPNGNDHANYFIDKMDHWNTTIYSVRVKILPNPLGHYHEA